MNERTPYSWPGSAFITELMIVEIISRVFDLKSSNWITEHSRRKEFAIPRQILMCCLIQFMGYTHRSAGFVCNRDHATAYYSTRIVNETLLNDREYGARVREIFSQLKQLKHEMI